MSMVRGSLHICTTSMLQGVITSRRPVLSAGEIEDVLASLSNGLRSSPGAASATAPSSATPTRRGFLRKASRGSASDTPPSAPGSAHVTPAAAVPPPIEPSPRTEPVPPSAEQSVVVDAPVVEPAHVVSEPISGAIAWPDASASAAVVEPVPPAHEPQHDYWPEPPTYTAEPEPAWTAAESAATEAPELAHDHRAEETTPLAAADAVPSVVVPTPFDDEIADLAHPVVPSDSSWDLVEEPPFEIEQDEDRTPLRAEPRPATWQDDSQPEPTAVPGPTPVGLAPIDPPAPVEPIQPSLTISAVSADASTPEPTLPRRPGGRRKAPTSKTGVSRLLPTLTPRPSARSSRRSAAGSSADGDSSQEGDLDSHGLTQEVTSKARLPVRRAPDGDDHELPPQADVSQGVPADDTDHLDPRPEDPWAADEAALVAAYASLQPVAGDLGTGTDHAPPDVAADPIVAQRSIEATSLPSVVSSQPEPFDSHEVTETQFRTGQQDASADLSEPYDFAELDEETSVAPHPMPTDDRAEGDSPPERKKKAKVLKRPRVRRSKDRAIEDDDVDLSQMPSNLSERGRQMYVEMQRRPKVDPTPRPTVQAASSGRAGAVRKLFVFCVIGGAIGISSSHYDEINGWVSTHVEHLPGLNKLEGPASTGAPEQGQGAKGEQGEAGQGRPGQAVGRPGRSSSAR